jgi:hypothetical protein
MKKRKKPEGEITEGETAEGESTAGETPDSTPTEPPADSQE